MGIESKGVTCVPLSPDQSVVYCHGGRIGFFQGDIRLLSDDMKALRPTIFPVVPRLLNRMYDKVSWVLILLESLVLVATTAGNQKFQKAFEDLGSVNVTVAFGFRNL